MYDPDETLCVMVVHPLEVVHWGLRALLGAEPWVDACVTAHGAERAARLAERYRPDVAVVDSSLDACAAIRRAHEATRVLLLSPDRRLPPHAAQGVGASGVVWSGASARDVVRAARVVSLGMTLFAWPRSEGAELLSARERDVLTLIAQGATNGEVADRLRMAETTAKQYVRTIYRKLNATSRVEAIRRAEAAGIFD